MVLVGVDRLDGRAEAELNDLLLVFLGGLNERVFASSSPRRNPLVSGGQLYGGSGRRRR